MLEVQRQNIARHCQQNFKNKKFLDITQQCFALLPQVSFPANNLNFHWRWRWWDWIQDIFLNLLYFNSMIFFQVFWWEPVVVVEICKLRRMSTKLWASGQGMPIQFWMFGIYPESNCFDSEILGVISPGKELGQINQISGLKNWKKTLCVSYFRFDCSFQICFVILNTCVISA